MKRVLPIFFSLAFAAFPFTLYGAHQAESNHLPVFFGPTNIEATVGTLVEFVVTVNDFDGDKLDITIDLPPGASFDRGTSLFRWIPQEAGEFIALFSASDGIGTSMHRVVITVKETKPRENHLPVFFGPEVASTTVGVALEFVVTVNDVDGDNLVVTTTLPEGAVFDPGTGIFQWTPQEAGTSTAIFSAFDGAGTSTHEVVIEVFPVAERENNLPIFFGPDSATTTVGTLLEFIITVNDLDGDNIVLGTSLPEGSVFAISTGLFSWTPLIAGTSTATFSAFDGIGTSTHEVLIEVFPVAEGENHLPVFFGPDSATTTLGTLLEFVVTVTDIDGDDIALSLALPEGSSFATSTSLFSWIPLETGTSTAFFSAFDGTGTSTHEVLIEVFESAMTTPNRLPVFTGPKNASSTVGALLELMIVASDPDGDSLNISSMLPGGASYATSSGTFSWTATSTGAYLAKFLASDGVGTTTHELTIDVAEAPPPPPPPPPAGGGGGGSGGGGGGSGGPPGPFTLPTTQGDVYLSSQIVPPPLPIPEKPPTPAITAPLKPAPKTERVSASVIKPVIPRHDGISIVPTTTAKLAEAEGRSLASVLFAGLFNFWDWLRAYCSLGWILWFLTLFAFILYVIWSRKKKNIEEEVPPLEVFEAELLPPEDTREYFWETYPQEK